MCRIDVQAQINVQVEKIKKNKRAGQNRSAGGFFSEKSINLQVEINVQGRISFSKY